MSLNLLKFLPTLRSVGVWRGRCGAYDRLDMTMNFVLLFVIITIPYSLADGKPVDATQELLATGLCNIGNSFFHAYPGSGSFSRSAVTAASGVRTPMEGLYAGENNNCYAVL